MSDVHSTTPDLTRAHTPSQFMKPVDVATAVMFRICFGSIMLWEVIKYFYYDWIREYYIEPTMLFKYYGFEWVIPWPGNGMYFHFGLLGIAAAFIALGLFYRLSCTVMFLGFAYVFLLDQTRYLNHFYLLVLISGTMIFVPAHRELSLDALIWPRLRSDAMPQWCLRLLQFHIGLPYFYGGLAKLNMDWVQGEPLRFWLSRFSDSTSPLSHLASEPSVFFFSYAGLVFDLAIVPCLLWRRTRVIALLGIIIFNLSNAFLFRIGVFPWFMLAATALFFEPSWPRRLVAGPERALDDRPTHQGNRWVAPVVLAYVFFHLLFPLRHWLYPGNASWTSEGHRFAWRMKLEHMDFQVAFVIVDHDEQSTTVVDPKAYLKRHQWTAALTYPDCLQQLAKRIAQEEKRNGRDHFGIHALANVALNGRDPQLLIDREVDLSTQPRSLRHREWILALEMPFRLRNYRAEQRATTASRRPNETG